MTETNMLDVTVLEPRQKHPTIFARFDDLIEGSAFTILNDHDPKPLYYQLLEERGDVFSWEYLEQGPDRWRVRITRRKTGESSETLGQVVAKDLNKAKVFKKYGLDFCCGGKKTVRQACAEKGLDVTQIEQELQEVSREKDTRLLPYDQWPVDFLADYIVNTHHRYVKSNLPDIRAHAHKVANVHGDSHPELITVNQLVESIFHELTAHLEIEERIVFPYIKTLAAVASGKAPQTTVDSIVNPIERMMIEHETVGQYLASIRTMTHDYELPEDACASYSLLYRMLDEFENDLHLHIHLENNILFPKSLELEEKLSL